MRLDDVSEDYRPTDTRLYSLSAGSVAASLELQSLVNPKIERNQPYRKGNTRRQAIPLPLMILVVGVAGSFSIWKYLRDSKIESVISDFKRDAWTIANQITNRVKRDVDESYTASFMGLAGGEDFTLESWRGFTQEYLSQNADGGIFYCPRVRNRNTTEFDFSARRAYREEGFRIFSRLPTGEMVFMGEGEEEKGDAEEWGTREGEPQDMYPILYMNPEIVTMIGYDMNSIDNGANAILRMVETNHTAVAEVTVEESGGLPLYAVVQPVFAGGNALGGIVGCAIKWTAVQQFVDGSLSTNKFAQRYPDSDMAVFMRVGVGSVEPEDQLLYDRRTYPNRTRELFLSGSLDPKEVENRGTATMFSEESLVSDKAIVVVASYSPPTSDRMSTVSLSIGCVASLLVALLVYGRQLLVLSYKDGMERATINSSFKSRFVADMAHEIRTPLNGIIGTAELLEEEDLSPTGFELVGTVRACSNILMGIVNDALDYSKTEIGEMRMEARPASLRKTLLEVMQIMQSAYRSPKGETVGDVVLRLEVDESVSRASVLADEARIRQVLVNLISNAFKFTDAGSITVTARYDPVMMYPESLSSVPPPDVAPTQILAAGNPAMAPCNTVTDALPTDKISGETFTGSPTACPAGVTVGGSERVGMRRSRWGWFLEFTERKARRKQGGNDPQFVKSLGAPPYKTAVFVAEIKDTGVGMTPQQMDGLFKPFSQVHHGSRRGVGGTGLGLAICKSLCESMGGSIGCTSSPGKGSTFRFNVLVGVNSDLGESTVDCVRSDNEDAADRATTNGETTPAATIKRSEKPETSVAQPRREKSRYFTREWILGMKGGVLRVKPGASKLDASAPRFGVPREQWADWAETGGVASVGGEDSRPQSERNGEAPRVADNPSRRGGGHASTVSSENIWLEAVAATSEERRAKELLRCPSSSCAVATIPERPRFLVVDDFRMNRLLVRKMVEALDAEVKFAEDGAEAVRACSESRFSLIFMDVMMPVMNGLEASKAIRAREAKLNRDTPIIAVTASPTLEGFEGDDEENVTDLITKPITRRPLFVMIAKWASERDVTWMSDAWSRHTETMEKRPGLAKK